MVPSRLMRFKKFTPVEGVDAEGITGLALIDVMGDERRICNAARTSYGRGTRKSLKNNDLIRYLMRHRHTTPFEFCEIVFFIRVPIDLWRQAIRHRTASVNEYSTRYSLPVDAMATTAPDKWRLQSESNRQGSDGYADVEFGKILSADESALHALAREVYQHRVNNGIAREQARKDLPMSNFTQAYWKIDLHNLLHFLELRMDSHAQHEIRMVANAMAEVVKLWVPHVWRAFEDFRLNAWTLSAAQCDFVQRAIDHYLYSGPSLTKEEILQSLREDGQSKREATDFMNRFMSNLVKHGAT